MAALQGGPLETTGVVRSAPEGTPLPPGIYHGMVTKTAQKETQSGGIMVEVEFDITHPAEHSNRKFWDRFNVVNNSVEAARIGKEGLADLAQAAGIQVLEDDEQLIGVEVMMELIVTPARPYSKNGQEHPGKPQNNCRKYWAVGTEIAAAKQAQKPAATAVKTAATTATPAGQNRWAGTAKAAPAARPAEVTPEQVQQSAAASAPATNAAAPWKRNKQ